MQGPDASALISVLVLPDSLSNNTYSVTHACIDYQAPQDMGCGCQMIGEETSQHRDTAESDTHHEVISTLKLLDPVTYVRSSTDGFISKHSNSI